MSTGKRIRMDWFIYVAGAQFPSVGTWWLRVNVAKDGYQDEVQFTIEVRPAL